MVRWAGRTKCVYLKFLTSTKEDEMLPGYIYARGINDILLKMRFFPITGHRSRLSKLYSFLAIILSSASEPTLNLLLSHFSTDSSRLPMYSYLREALASGLCIVVLYKASFPHFSQAPSRLTLCLLRSRARQPPMEALVDHHNHVYICVCVDLLAVQPEKEKEKRRKREREREREIENAHSRDTSALRFERSQAQIELLFYFRKQFASVIKSFRVHLHSCFHDSA